MSGAEILEIMREAVETRKKKFLELALDLIQRLITHRALLGHVDSINHRGDLAAAKGMRRTAVPVDGATVTEPQARTMLKSVHLQSKHVFT